MEEKINSLLDALIFVENKETREIMLKGFVAKYGEIPDEYKDAVEAVMEM